jgi:hypothetical protein
MGNNYIKNKTRSLRQEHRDMGLKEEPYQPEYVRLGVEPLRPRQVSEADHFYSNRNRNNSRQGKSVNSKEMLKQNIPNVISKAPPSVSFEEKNIPKSNFVASGNNMEHAWVPQREQAEIDVNEDQIFYDEVSLPSDKETVSFDTQPDYVQSKEDEQVGSRKWVSSSEKESSHNYFAFNFFVAIRGQIVFGSDNIDDIENYIESIIFKDQGDLKQGDFVVMKRLPLKVGVCVSL